MTSFDRRRRRAQPDRADRRRRRCCAPMPSLCRSTWRRRDLAQELKSLPGALCAARGRAAAGQARRSCAGLHCAQTLEPPRSRRDQAPVRAAAGTRQGRGQGAGRSRPQDRASNSAMARSSWTRCRRWKALSRSTSKRLCPHPALWQPSLSGPGDPGDQAML